MIGDELVMGSFPLSNLTALAARLHHCLTGHGIFVYTNEGFRAGPESAQRCESAHDCPSKFDSGAGNAVCSTFPKPGAAAGHKYCNQPQWSTIPAGLDFISADVYNSGAVEAKVAKQHYEHYLFPALQHHQKLFLVPGLYGPNGTQNNPVAIRATDIKLEEKLQAHLEWAHTDERIAGVFFWHWSTLPQNFHPSTMTEGGSQYPKTLRLVKELVTNASYSFEL